MREIKFRVWDEIAKQMWHPEQGLKACVTQIGRVCVDETDDGGILENRNYRLIAMFYTGLKDKNGKEIYEGDIVKAIFNSSIHTVEWRNDQSQWSIGGFGQWKVIGNIYENPELLAT